MRTGTVYPDGEAYRGPFYTTILFFVVRAEVFHGIPEKNQDFAIQFFVQTIFHFSTSLHRPLVPHTIVEL